MEMEYGKNGWRLLNGTLKERHLHLLGNDLMSDIIFIVGVEKTKIPSHKLFLSAASSVFYELFYLTTPIISEIIIEGVEVPIFMKFLEYIYTGEIKLNSLTIPHLQKLAHRYNVIHLKILCDQYKPTDITIDNVIEIYEEFAKLPDQNSHEKCLEIISTQTSTILKHKSFLNASVDTVCKILELPKLQCQEIELYRAVSKWTEKECSCKNIKITGENKRSLLGHSFHSIRFPTMKLTEIIECAKDINSLLKKDEVKRLTDYCISDNKENVDIKFLKSHRYTMLGLTHNNKYYEICNILKHWHVSVESESAEIQFHHVQFSISKAKKLYGLGFLKPQNSPNPSKFFIAMRNDDIQQTPILTWTLQGNSNNYSNIKISNDVNMIRIFFNPILLQPNQYYFLFVIPDPSLIFVNNVWRRDIVLDGFKVTMNRKIDEDSYCRGNIAELILQ